MQSPVKIHQFAINKLSTERGIGSNITLALLEDT